MKKKYFHLFALCLFTIITLSSCSSSSNGVNKNSKCDFTPHRKQDRPAKKSAKIAPRTPVTGVFNIQ